MILSQVQQFIDANKLFDKKSRIIVGLSGGADSVALFDMLISLGYDCIAAHCNFHLRGEESNRDEAFVKNLCLGYNQPLHTIDFDTEQYASDNSISIEMAARELRYKWFENLRLELKADYIAIAHHQDDSVETVLLNLIRGTGIKGLTGINPKNGYIVRPLLSITRNDIIKYLSDKQLDFVEDYTNQEDIYTRNKIRLSVLPLLESINPSVKESIRRTAENLQQVETIYNYYIADKQSIIVSDNKISIPKLLEYIEPKAILFETLSKYGFNSASVNQIFNSLEGISGKQFFSEKYQVIKDRDCLIINKIEDSINEEFVINKLDTFLSQPIPVKIEVLKLDANLNIERSPNIFYADYDKLFFPLKLRHWKQGDWFIPFGMRGRKKISDYFSDNKFSLIEKEHCWLLCSQDDIIWIVGHRSDDRYKITNKTQQILKISIIE